MFCLQLEFMKVYSAPSLGNKNIVFLTRSNSLEDDFGFSPKEIMLEIDLKSAIVDRNKFDEQETKNLLETIIADREQLEHEIKIKCRKRTGCSTVGGQEITRISIVALKTSTSKIRLEAELARSD